MPKTILCVDDDANVLKFYDLMLDAYGYEVLTANGGLQALAILRCRTVDCVVLDYQMPRDGGLVAAEIRRLYTEIPIIMVSAAPVPDHVRATVDRCADKDDLHTGLLNTIKEVLSGLPHRRHSTSRFT